MKKILLLILSVLTTMLAIAQSPAKISYQAVVRDANNRLLTNSAVDVQFQILDASSAVLYDETHASVNTNANGLLSLYVGDGTPASGTYSADVWQNATQIRTVVTYSGATLEDVTVPVTAVPAALYALDLDPASVVYATIRNDSLVLATAINDLGDKVTADSTVLHNALIDTAAAIRSEFPVVNDGTLTIQINGTDAGSFTANQGTAETVNIAVPTTVAELTDAGDYALKTGSNLFTGDNDFTGAVTVPNAITDLQTTLANPCTQNAVNVCDLLAVFDSLERRIAKLETVIGTVLDNSATPTVITSPVSGVSATEALVGGELISAGTTTIIERGICYNTTGTPTISDTKVAVSGTGTGEYTSTITGIQAGTTYYIRAYVITDNNDAYYGEEVTFNTLQPTLTVVSDTTSPLEVCGSSIDVNYTASMINDDITNYALKWYVNDVEQTGETDIVFSATFTATNKYAVKCEASRTGATVNGSDTMDITIYTSPSMTLTRLEGNTGDDFGKVEITESHCVASAKWVFNGDSIGNWISGKTDILPVGTYTVNITGTPGCGTATQTVTTRTSPVCIPQIAINPTLETVYELAGEQYVKTIKDHENNEYNVVQIGTRCWTRENMRAVTSPTTGSYLILPDVTMRNSASKGAIWPIDSADAVSKSWGVQYNWQAMVDVYNSGYPEICAGKLTVDVAVPTITHPHRGICPEGWHVPVNGDFNDLHTVFPYMGQLASNNGDGSNNWTSATGNSPGNVNYSERNASGFSAVPAGMDGGESKNDYAIFWSGTEYSASQNWRGYLRAIQYNYTTQNWYNQNLWHHEMCAVRCIRNN